MSAEAAPRTARKRRARWAIGALVAIVLIAATWVVSPMILGGLSRQAAAVPSAPVESGRLVVTTSADGSAVPIDSHEVYAEVNGTVEAVDVEVGDTVKAGDELFTIDDSDLRAAVRSASAQLKQADQQLASANQQVESAELQVLQAENKLDTLESRPATLAASAGEIDEAEQGIVVAKAGLSSAKKGLASAKTAKSNAQTSYDEAVADLDKVTVTAPAAGIVTAVNVAVDNSVSGGSGGTGSAATAGSASGSSGGSSAAVVISETSALKISVAVNEVDIAEVQAGQEATVTFDAIDGLELPAKVAWVSPNADSSSGSVTTYEVELEIAEQDERLRAGMTATADIVTVAIDDALLIPKSSVKVDGSAKYVTVVKADGTTEKRTITSGPSDDTRVQVLTGLEAGEQVAITASSSDEQQGGGFMPPSPGGLTGGRPNGLRQGGQGGGNR